MTNRITFALVLVTVLFLVAIVSAQNGVNYAKTLSAADKAQLLDTHNRARLAVGAKIMANLTWDQNLADIWPKSNPNFCTFNHFSGRNTAYGATVGENLYASSYSTINLDSFVQSWVNEKVDYKLGKYPEFCGTGKVCGHYTQIVWSATTKVGCALFDCTTLGGWRNLLVCNYYTAGNYLNQYAYEVGTGTPTCVPTDPCVGVACGTKVNNCGQTVSCSNTCSSTQSCSSNTCTACPSQCGTKTCGSVFNSCYNKGNGGTEMCGANQGGCPTGQTCTSNQCVTPPTTCTPTITQSYCDGSKCGSFSNGCGGTVSCTCGAGTQCQSSTCVAIPCGGTCRSDLFEQCTNNQCSCVTGYTRDALTGACVATPPPSNGNPLSKWEPFLPVPPATGSTDWVLLPDGSRLEMVGTGASNYRMRWLTSPNVVKEEKTIFKTDVLLNGNGEFGLALREQPTKTAYSLWRLTISGTSVNVNWDTSSSSTRNRAKSPLYSGWKANDWNTVELTMADLPQYDAQYQTNYVWFTLKVNGVVVTPSTYNGYPQSSFSNTGSVFIYTKQYAAFKNTYLITTTTLLVTFAGCLSSSQLSSICATYGATDCRIESPCSSSKRQAELSSTAVITFTSSDTVSSDAFAAQFTHAVSSQDPRLAEYSITKVEDGSQFAGEQTVDESQVSIEQPTETNVEGTGGGGESGLSTGGIIGVAVAGGVVALAVAAVVVAALAVAGVLVARKIISSKNQHQLSGNNAGVSKESSDNRNVKTGADLFDYDDDPENKHKSITARVPEGFADSISHL